MAQSIPPQVYAQTRDWAWLTFSFGEWQEKSEIVDFIRQTFNYRGSTPTQYAEAFLRKGVENRDFELRNRQWRWIVHGRPA